MIINSVVAGDRGDESQLSGLVRPPSPCVKSGDLTGESVVCCAPVTSPGVLRPPLGIPLPENSCMVGEAGALATVSAVVAVRGGD